jgi:hypothetical protein
MAMHASMWVATHYRIECTDSKDHNERTTSDYTERLRVLRVPAHSFHFITVPTPNGRSLTRNESRLTRSRLWFPVPLWHADGLTAPGWAFARSAGGT